MCSRMDDGLHAQRRLRHVFVTGVLALMLVGCTAGSSTSAVSATPVSSEAVAAPVAGAGVVVTVPDLASSGPAVPGLPAPASHAPRSVTAKPAPRSSAVGSTMLAPRAPSATSVLNSSVSSSSVSLSSVSLSSVAGQPTVTAAPATSVPTTFEVTLANCAACTVLATHAAVTQTLGAALVATGPGHAALLSIKRDGGVGGAVNLLYGSTFPTPPGGQLACDSGGRCIVIAQQADGTAIASAYQVSAAGAWTDVTGRPITSATAIAQTLAVGDGVGVAVQDQADGSTVWTVYTWDGHGYSVKGCTAASTPAVNTLSITSCLS